MFFYFDLGKVILDFNVERMCRQIADVGGIGVDEVKQAVFENRLQGRYERGEISTQEFYEEFCRATGSKAACEALTLAASDIFELNVSIIPVVAQLQAAGYRLGILSNTCPGHWEHCVARYRILRDTFSVYALSYELKAAKPDETIYRAAASLAGVKPEEVFYTDDLLANVAGAQAAGFDAVQYTSTPQLVAELLKRGVRFNY